MKKPGICGGEDRPVGGGFSNGDSEKSQCDFRKSVSGNSRVYKAWFAIRWRGWWDERRMTRLLCFLFTLTVLDLFCSTYQHISYARGSFNRLSCENWESYLQPIHFYYYSKRNFTMTRRETNLLPTKKQRTLLHIMFHSQGQPVPTEAPTILKPPSSPPPQ